MRIDAHARAAGELDPAKRAGRRREVVLRILGVDAHLDRAAERLQIGLREAEPLTGCDTNLFFDQVDPVHHLGNRMLDLDAGVHLHEVDVGSVDQKFERAGVGVLHGSRGGDRDIMQTVAHRRIQCGRRRFLDELLVRWLLHRTVAFAEVHDIAVLIAQHLHFDVPRGADQLLDVHAAIFERRFGFGRCGGKRRRHFRGRFDRAHALAAAAGRRFEQHGIADLGSKRRGGFGRRENTAAGRDRHARLVHDPARRRLVAHGGDDARFRTNERETVVARDFGEACVLGEKSVARVNRIGTADQSGRDDVRDVEIRRRNRPRADAERLIGMAHVQRAAIGLAEYSDGRNAEFVTCTIDAQRDLAAIGDEYLTKHGLPFDREQRLTVLDRLAVGDVDHSDASRAARANRIADSKRFDVSQLAVTLERHSLTHGGAQVADDAHDISQNRFDGSGRGRLLRRARCGCRGAAERRPSAAEFHLELALPYPQPR